MKKSVETVRDAGKRNYKQIRTTEEDRIAAMEARLDRVTRLLEQSMINRDGDTEEDPGLASDLYSPAKKSKVKEKPKKRLEKVPYDGSKAKFWEVESPMTVRAADLGVIKRWYKSLDGHRISIFYINKNKEFPIVGAIEVSAGVWEPRIWNAIGGPKDPFGKNNTIVGFWGE